eukprot:880903_1
MKQYIRNYTTTYSFDINYAKILYDFEDGLPTIHTLRSLKQNYKGFIIKPNHFSGQQIVIKSTDVITRRKYKRIINTVKKWSHKKYKTIPQGSGKFNREPWYELIKPRVFIEENLNIRNGINGQLR